MKRAFRFKYPVVNIKLLLASAFASALTANFVAPLIAMYIVFGLIESRVLVIWFALHILILVARIYIAKQLEGFIKKSKDIVLLSRTLLFLISFTALLYGVMLWISAVFALPDANVYMLAMLLFTLSAGSIATLMSVFHIFAIFVLINMLSIISASLYHGGEMFYVLTLLSSIFIGVFIKAGHKQFVLINSMNALQEMFQFVYDQSNDGIAIVHKSRLRDCNISMAKMFGYDSKEEFLKISLSSLMPKYQESGKSSLKQMLHINKETFKKGHNAFEWTYKKKDGTLFWVDVVLTKVFVDEEELIHGVYRDISVQKELEEQREEFQNTLMYRVQEEVAKNREKDKAILQQSKLAQMGEMIRMIAHQWRQPLSAISATSSSLELKATLGNLENEKVLELSKKITEYAQHLSKTIDDFRNFFKDNKLKESVTLDAMVESTLEIVEVLIEHKNIQLELDLNAQKTIETYANEVKQVILNIIKNAEDAFIEKNIMHPKISITTSDYKITIEDNAGGIEGENIERIFEPYFSTKKEKDGTGLGLYMSKMIIEEHCNGKLSVRNAHEGAIFELDFKVNHG